MARQPRFFIPGEALHVIQRGNNREPIFAADEDFQFFLRCLGEAREVHGLAIHAYVLMTNHVHMVATPAHAQSLPKTLQSVGRRYVQHFNRNYRRTGTLWEGRYRATLIDSEEYLLTCMRYVELNPVRARIVDDPMQYRWCSYHVNAHGRPDPIIAFHDVYLRLGSTAAERQSAYRALFGCAISSAAVELIRETTNKNWALGNERFKRRIEELSGRRSAPAPRGPQAKRKLAGFRV